ncbi:transcription termination factor NusA [Poriferisphaera sp. WC338]|uniref:transcription termination factor NusA n=1 Tax=Poriferisphaera sp. WC338 TaxID=3425129 RepID=UPI003D818664
MNSSEMLRVIDSIARERNVDKEALFHDIEQAMVSAARKHFNTEGTEEFRSEVDRLTGQIRLWQEDVEIPLEELGRIPAQTAKQVMIQRFREDERQSIYNEFADRVGELTTGMAQRYEGGALVVQVGRAEGFMPKSEQIPGEQHQAGERVRCMILDVRESGNQVKIVLSRGSAEFIRRLFEVEVPEVSERIIEIKAMAREPGHRTKIAVSSIDSKVDAVGACVGVRGSRIKNIVDELGGEKIDIVRWNESSQILIQNALKPAEVVEISLCFELGRATVVVNEDQLSLAIGKRGQNVRLAARLTNWDIDILTPPEYTKSLDAMESCLREIDGFEDTEIDKLAALGVISVFDIEEVGAAYLAEQLQIEEALSEKVVEVATARGKVLAAEQAKEKEEAEKRKQAERDGMDSMPGAAQAAAILGDILGPGSDAPATEEAAPESTETPVVEEAAEEAVVEEEVSADVEAEVEAEVETEDAPESEDASANDEEDKS